jgi:hypothetical protein
MIVRGMLGWFQRARGFFYPPKIFFPCQQLNWTTSMVQQKTVTYEDKIWTSRLWNVRISVMIFLA